VGRLDVEEVDAGYGDFQALYQLSLHVDSGETVAIIGANGAGKTTLLRAVMGQVKVRSGTIRYAGQDDLVVPCSFANRNQLETESLIGNLATALPLRARLSDVRRWLAGLK